MNFTREVAVVDSKHISKATGSCAEISNRTHRRDSTQGTDYIANYFLLNLWFSSAKWQIGEDIIALTSRQFVTSLVQKLKILEKKLICSHYLDWQFLLSLNILSFWTYDVTNFPKVSEIMSPPIYHIRFSIYVLETLKFERQCSQYLELNPTCGTRTLSKAWTREKHEYRKKTWIPPAAFNLSYLQT